MKTPEQRHRGIFHAFYRAFIVDFELVNVSWDNSAVFIINFE